MQFNSEASNNDLYSDCRDWCGIEETDTTTYPLTKFTRAANKGLDKAVTLIMKSDARWKWDDLNQTDLPIGTTDLVSGQIDYGLDTSHLKVRRVRIKDPSGTWITLDRVSRRERTDSQENATSGTPESYDLIGNSVYLDKQPNYSSTGGVEVQFQRGASYFVTTDTTKKPGIASQFHQLISLYPAEEYCAKNDMSKRLAAIQKAIEKMEADVQVFYSQRDEDEQPQITFKRNDYGESALGNGFAANDHGF